MYERKKRLPSRKPECEMERVPPRTEEEEQKLACGYAMDLALKWLKEGTAPAQIVTHFLKVASLKEQAELKKIERETELLIAKRKAVEAAEAQDKKYEEVIRALSTYAGKDQEWEVVDEDYPSYR